ncbi:MAG TPA: TlpA disulfide reductase family protein [Candidatus Sulfotelmatobacter sp.]|nr:TlpA disulfide reductase family protein [Candidatus Sulfotelmatobacter sp.]
MPPKHGLIGPFTGRQIALALVAVAVVAVVLVIVSSPIPTAPPPLPSVGNGFVTVGPATADLQVGQPAPELSGLVPTDAPSRTVPLALIAGGALVVLLGLGLVRRTRVALLGVVGGLIVALVGVPLLLAPGPAPQTASLVDLKGAPITLAQYAGHPIWIDFFATWCPPCQQETPTLEAVYTEHRAEGLVLLAISVQETSADDVQAYATQYGLTFPIGFDATSAVFKAYSAYGLPTQVFIDRDGIVRSVVRGPLDQTGAEQQLAPILSGGSLPSASPSP